MASSCPIHFIDHVGYVPELEHRAEIESALERFATSHLSSLTEVKNVTLQSNMTSVGVEISTLGESDIKNLASKKSPDYNLFFISKSLIRKKAIAPTDPAKLRISKLSFEALASHFSTPLAFIDAVARYHLPSGRGFKSYTHGDRGIINDVWYILPIRIQVWCHDRQQRHTHGTAKSSQMDPFKYLHLPDHNADIRGSRVALCFHHEIYKGNVTMIAVNFLDGKWPKCVEESQNRIVDILQNHMGKIQQDPSFLHSVYLTSIIRWWADALSTMNAQLITYESRLQEDTTETTTSNQHQDMNKALHAMAAHLHRYGTELASIDETVSHIATHHEHLRNIMPNFDDEQFEKSQQVFAQISSQLKAVINFEAELEKKIQNILALLFNRIQLGNDRIMVANGTAMQEMMLATQQETRISRALAIRAHEMTEEMKKDSLSMKTIAVLTMFFLPGTSFAALLAMPFFSSNKWLDDISRFWVWIALTVPSTGLAFAFYTYWKRRGESAALKTKISFDDDVELCDIEAVVDNHNLVSASGNGGPSVHPKDPD